MKNKNNLKSSFFLIVTMLLLAIFNNPSYAQLSGTYTIGAGGDFVTIDSAVNNLALIGVSGPVTFEIITGVYTERVTIDSIPGASSVNTVTFQSRSGNRDDVYWKDSVNFTSSIVKFNSADHITFKNISFRFGTSTSMQYVFEFSGQCEGISINNNNIIAMSRESYGLYCDNGETRNLTIENNYINARTAISLSGTTQSVGTKIIRNLIERYEGIIISKNDSLQIDENNISIGYLDAQAPGYPNAKGIILQDCNLYLRISKNKIHAGGLPRYAQSKGVEINNSNCQNSLIVNNFIDYTGGGGLLVLNSSNINIYYNTIRTGVDQLNVNVPNLSASNCSVINVLNNIIGGVDITRIDYTSNTTLNSNYNTFTPANGSQWPETFYRFNGTEYYDLSSYSSASDKDTNSNEHPVTFVSSVNLHLAGASIGDSSLIAMPITGIIDDIDGHIRSQFYPYKGADEADVVLPVEMTSFSSEVIERNITLYWTTSSELNNSGFEIERSEVNEQLSVNWVKIGRVEGNGTSGSTNNYTFNDRNLNTGKYNYRLKQIDYNGNFEYFNLDNEVVIGVPVNFSLNQNYPNPFNPSTVISYQIPAESFVSLKIFDITGKEVAALVNEKLNAGYYSIDFNGSGISSGVYFYSLNSDGFTDTKRMTLLK